MKFTVDLLSLNTPVCTIFVIVFVSLVNNTNVQQILYQICIVYISKTVCLLMFTLLLDVTLCSLVNNCQKFL
jgi:ATP/ADP translocase